jgi:hypothetical protein
MTFQEGQSTYAVLAREDGGRYRKSLAVVSVHATEEAAVKSAAVNLEQSQDLEATFYIAHVFKKVKLDRPTPPLVVTELKPVAGTEF